MMDEILGTFWRLIGLGSNPCYADTDTLTGFLSIMAYPVKPQPLVLVQELANSCQTTNFTKSCGFLS